MNRWVRNSLMAVSILFLTGITLFLSRNELTRYWEGLPAFTHSSGESYSEWVSVQDGLKLHTTVQLPSGLGPYPTILIRNPYAEFGTIMRDTMCGRFVRYGYACVFQDVRGQGLSEGAWQPGVNEIGDGRDTLNWLVKQKFQDGNIAMVGASYLASVQWAAAIGGMPEEVKTFVPAVFATNNHAVMYQEGMFRHETFTAWASMMRGSNSDAEDAGGDYHRAIKHLPHNQVDEQIFGQAMPWYQDMINSASPTAKFWSEPGTVQLRAIPSSLEVPILMIGGWYDVFIGPQLQDWQQLATRSRSRFVIGPWTHIGGGSKDLETPDAEGGLNQWKEMLPWLEHHLKGGPLMHSAGVKAYVMRENVWKEYTQWPPTGTPKRFFLGNLAQARGCTGGSLTANPPQTMSRVNYEYNPNNPVPTRGGAGMLAFILPGFNGAPPANVLQNGLCERQDILSFTTQKLESALKIAGDISVSLSVSSSANDTAFTAKLVEILPDGREINVRDSITSLAYRNGARQPLVYTANTRVDIKIKFWPIEWTLAKGSRLRLDISSSDFPKFHAHRNQAGNWAEHTQMLSATQSIYSGEASWVEFNSVM